MKIIEPLSSALLLTGCIYAAGITQNAYFISVFGINPAFSQPAIDKIFYDGGMITFELFVRHLIITTAAIITLLLLSASLAIIVSKTTKKTITEIIKPIKESTLLALKASSHLSGILALFYLILLTFFSYEKAKIDGANIAKTFIETCHTVILKKENNTTKGCAFNKDRDSIWYYTITNSPPQASSKLLSELDEIIYLDPVEQ